MPYDSGGKWYGEIVGPGVAIPPPNDTGMWSEETAPPSVRAAHQRLEASYAQIAAKERAAGRQKDAKVAAGRKQIAKAYDAAKAANGRAYVARQRRMGRER